MNSKNSKNSDPLRLILNLTDKMSLKGSDEYAALPNLSIYYIWEKYTKTINLKYQRQRGMINLSYMMDHILYQIFKIILSISSKTMKECPIVRQ